MWTNGTTTKTRDCQKTFVISDPSMTSMFAGCIGSCFSKTHMSLTYTGSLVMAAAAFEVSGRGQTSRQGPLSSWGPLSMEMLLYKYFFLYTPVSLIVGFREVEEMENEILYVLDHVWNLDPSWKNQSGDSLLYFCTVSQGTPLGEAGSSCSSTLEAPRKEKCFVWSPKLYLVFFAQFWQSLKTKFCIAKIWLHNHTRGGCRLIFVQNLDKLAPQVANDFLPFGFGILFGARINACKDQSS